MDPCRPLWRLLAPLLAHPAWPRLRALLIALHVFAVVAVACPAPIQIPGPSHWQRPGVKEELRAWQRRLDNVGVHRTDAELIELTMTTVRTWSAARNSAVKPFSVYLRTIGAPQGWYMFTGPDRSPQRFRLDVVRATGERVHVFTLGEPLARPDLIDQRFIDEHRVRRALFQSAWAERKALFRDVCGWLGRHVREKMPDSKEAVCSLIESMVEHPWQPVSHIPPRAKKTVRVPLDVLRGGASPEHDENLESDAPKKQKNKKPKKHTRQADDSAAPPAATP